MLIAVKSKRFSVTGYKRMFVILIKKTLGSGFKYSAFDYCDNMLQVSFSERELLTLHVLKKLNLYICITPHISLQRWRSP